MTEPRKDVGDALAELFVELVDHGVPPVLQGRTTGWVQPRDDDRDPQPFDPKMDRHAIGTNAPTIPEQRNRAMSTTTKTKDGIVESLSATVRPDLRPPGMGACVCPPGTLYASCTCAWSTLIDRLLFFGYGRTADPVTIAREISATATWFHRDIAPVTRRYALTTLARQWQGTLREFAKMLGVTAPAIRKAAPAAARMIRERTG